MSAVKTNFARLIKRYSPSQFSRGSVIRRVAMKFDLIPFGAIHPDDDMTPILGFTTSTTHIDANLCVGTHDDYSVRIVDRFDIVKTSKALQHAQNWLIIEIELGRVTKLPHVTLVPTGKEAKEYHRLFNGLPYIHPLNTSVFQTHSNELHGRFQIMARPIDAAKVEETLTTPLIMGIVAKFWPYGIELRDNKVYVYITDHRLSGAVVSQTLVSSIWLARQLDDAASED